MVTTLESGARSTLALNRRKPGAWAARLGKHLLWAQVTIPGSWERAPGQAPCGAQSLLLPLPLPLLVLTLGQINKMFKKKNEDEEAGPRGDDVPRPRPHSPQVLRPGRGLRGRCRGGSSHARPGPGRPFTASRALERPQGAAQQFRAEGERRRSLRSHRTSWSSGASAARPQPKARECD